MFRVDEKAKASVTFNKYATEAIDLRSILEHAVISYYLLFILLDTIARMRKTLKKMKEGRKNEKNEVFIP